MNVLTVAVFSLALLYIGAALIYVWRAGRRLRRPWFIRCSLFLLAGFAMLEVLGIAFDYRDSLPEHGVGTSLLQSFLWTTYAFVWIRMAKPPGPVDSRYAFALTRQDRRLIFGALTLPALGLLLVLAFLIAHALGALA